MDSPYRFRDRREAGRLLARALASHTLQNPVVLALPRGGVPVAYEIARALGAPLDVRVVRKIGIPWHPELGLGAVAEGGYVHLSPAIVERAGLTEAELRPLVDRERREVEQRVLRFRGRRPPPTLRDHTVVLVDDGIATGGTARAAIDSIRAEGPTQVVLAVPVAARDTLQELACHVEEVVCLQTPADFYSVAMWYEHFAQVSDDEVVALLTEASG